MSGNVDFFFRHFWSENDVGDDFDGGVESAAVDGSSVEKCVARRLTVANAAKFLQTK